MSDPFAQRRHGTSEREISDLRPPFAIDCDRILHSLAYTRYIDKTQVFYLLRNDHITHRVLHVQLVSRIARTIGLKLGLDLDLIEAAALGHDIGHTPFGHDGERILAGLCLERGIGGKSGFSHAVMGVRFLERLEKNGLGLNLTLGVLDAILCHDGESDAPSLTPGGDPSFEEFDRRLAIREEDPSAPVMPMTAEGCVVRLSDSISYVGRDLEDAVLLGVCDRSWVPQNVASTLGTTNGTIVYRLVEDLIRNSQKAKGSYGFSKQVGEALRALKNFNRQHIYYNTKVKKDTAKIKSLFTYFFKTFEEDFARNDGPSIPILRKYLERMGGGYREQNSPAHMARDFIAGMTDDFFLRTAEDLLIPEWRREV
ncbi:MAG: HD domain-containing protein [Deltaproteobacteria bacterium]|nr:HD domain-containing protein [Deltaproteobacteria bacterium]